MARSFATRNENNTDRVIRTGLGALLFAGAVWAGLASGAGIVLLVLAAILLGTAAVGTCPLYYALGVSTYPTLHRTRRPHVAAAQSS